ncbi:structural maintenance of chromosome 2 [Nematocida minor]|uniref:structural maintenance of chromosome 2 n=1 Tax=Nematocida minor TaxID=1912983 RepID=UPI0022210F57|nr:structural maintenance of chromosome 2 [Nematocida minor]KAI5189167.1 structural maintenance of chromosome 2 [Nematocida minor]
MHLESVEIEGFKSYGSRTVIGPVDRSFTGITGLNGTGKSNILDAICFVLGVDTPRLLRSSSMKDLIFKQSKTTMGSAKVSLVFSNKEKDKGPVGYEEIDTIKLTRIISEEGKTKYLLNDHNVSTKTVLRLLQCVGLSSSKAGFTNEGARVEKQAPYFIVMQGRVSRILSMKSTQFLTLLEECSGTSVYRTEKYKAYTTLEKKEKKLLETQDTLSKTIFPFLERLRKERDEYYAHKEAAEKQQFLEKEVKVCRENLEYKKAELAVAEKERIEKRNEEIEAEIENKTKEMASAEVEDEDIAGIQERIDNKSREIGKMMIDLQEEEIKQMRKTVERADTEIFKVQGQYRKMAEYLQTEEERKEKEADRKRKTKEKKESDEEEQENISYIENNLKKEIEHALAKLEAKERALHQAGRQKGTLEKERAKETLSIKIEKMAKDISKLEEEIKNSERKGIRKMEAIESIEKHRKLKPEAPEEIRRRIEKIKRELGYPAIEGVYGKVKELIEVKEKEHQVAVGVVIGGRKEYVIVENEEIGKKVLQEASKEGRRVDVIPLNKIIGRRMEPRKEAAARKHGGIPLIDAIEYPEEIKKAMEYLTGGYALSKDRKTAVQLRDSEGITSVTIEGEVFDKRGTITGGSIDVRKYQFEKTNNKEMLTSLQNREKQVRSLLEECSFKKLEELKEYIRVSEAKEKLMEGISHAKAELDVLGKAEVQKEEIKSVSEKIKSLTGIRNILNAEYEKKESTEERLKDAEEKLRASKERESRIKEEIDREEIKKFEGIKNNEINKARRSIQTRERRRIEDEIAEIKKEKIKNDIQYRKIEHITIKKRKSVSQTKEELEERLASIEEELKYVRAIPRKDVNEENIEILQRNEEIEKALKERIVKLQKNKATIEESLNKLNGLEKEAIEGIYHSVNERIGKYIRYFIPNSDAKLEAINGSPMNGVELHVKIGTWKKGLTELSGGQKSLCALSLIFALLKTKPSPLYILDEIDAALDASHTEAMGRMIQKEFKGSQFVVVSLKDGMYHNANVLFQTYIREGTSGVRRM